MNKNRAILALMLISLISLFLFNSCSMEQELDTANAGTHNITFTAELPVSALVTTRGTAGTLAENRVRQLDLFVFAKNGNLKEIRQVTPSYEGTDLIHKVVKFSTLLEKGNSYDFMLVANARGSIPSLAVDGTVTQDAVAAALIFTQTAILELSDADSGVIPMWASLKNVTVASDGTVNKTSFANTTDGDTGLTRIYAKVNVSAVGVATTTFELTRVAFYNYNTKGRIVPENAKYPFTNSDSPSLPASPTPENNAATSGDLSLCAFNITDQSNQCENKIYVLEAATVASYGGTDWVKNPCLIVGGKYNGATTPTYYRIDIIGKNKAGTTGQWLSILRNHIYDVTITGVTDKGYDNEEKALNSAPINMTSVIVPWDDGQHASVDISGPDYLRVTPSNIRYASAEGNVFIQLKSSLNWVAEYYDAEGAVIPESNWWFTIEEKEGELGDNISVTINIKESIGNTPREGYILFSAGRMTAKVNVRQLYPVMINIYEYSKHAECESYEHCEYNGELDNGYYRYNEQFEGIESMRDVLFFGFPEGDKYGNDHLHFSLGDNKAFKYVFSIKFPWKVVSSHENIRFNMIESYTGSDELEIVSCAKNPNESWEGEFTLLIDGLMTKTYTVHQCDIISGLEMGVEDPSKIFYYDLMSVNGYDWLDRDLGATSISNLGALFTEHPAEKACPYGFRFPLDDFFDSDDKEFSHVFKNIKWVGAKPSPYDGDYWCGVGPVDINDQNGNLVSGFSGWYLPLNEEASRNWIFNNYAGGDSNYFTYCSYWGIPYVANFADDGSKKYSYGLPDEIELPVRCIRSYDE